ncbi:hypothetical protein AX774_g3607 [Zancudomyces culisetae]|uniref:Uncharacterized protein n=1 Tax=Zancudomyces culisetae TaxID=1213189 RepID=A0A1R1PPN5_ZANCU|nr:hypothetical protein AX774_g3607 [Zancudomyces culisetae]|eukprot:OMH82901.1 hypothetical protein AX774_g3607 [Zancudomyces culisetae]
MDPGSGDTVILCFVFLKSVNCVDCMDMSSESQMQGCCTDYDDEQKVEHNEGNDKLFTSAEKTLYKEISGRLLKLLQE